ncbi:putative endothiapepsin [Venustampulla echinocandica]|uniref:Putative endothiapepsin n=1 Tax=Venustampulla echinocandica TaxID=2656787 RepID=A0A370U1C6_9HELO|nr:putative endothiapepsin [Venustampulla echinocandica]RDL41578.1 putative endothiapepsin [Venustampulla echinocandica]
MLSALSLLALAAVVVQAAPTPATDSAVVSLVGSKQFSAPAVKNPNAIRNGTLALLKAYAKHNLIPTQDFSPEFLAELNQLKKRQDTSTPAVPYQQVEYLVNIAVAGQKLNLDFDTGSADLWVFSDSLPASSKKGHNIYTPSSSPSYKVLSGHKWSIAYADGSGASGTVGTDTVTIGGTSVTNQAVELADRISSSFVTDGLDGLLGLSFSSINTVKPTQQKTWFDNAKASLSSPLFAAYLPFNANGAYDFGYLDSAHYSGTPVYAPVDDTNGFWEVASTSYKVGGTTHSLPGNTGILDTGTTLALMVDSAVSAYYAQVSGAVNSRSLGGWVFPCKGTTLPDLSVRLGPTNYATIPGKLLNFQPADASGTQCYGGLQSVGGGTMNVYGDVFFNAFYGIFDANGPRFGFAPLK